MQRENLYSRDRYIRKIQNREISLIELAKFVLTKWKLILILSAVFYLGLIIAVIISDSKIDNETQQPSVKESTVSQLTDEQQKKIYDIVELKEKVEKLENYKKNSTCMNLDPYACNVNTLQYLIRSDKLCPELNEAYSSYAEGGLKNIVDEKLGEEIVRPSDLVIIFSNLEKLKEQELSENKKAYVTCLKIVTADEDTNIKITEVVKNALKEYHDYLKTVMGDHDLILLSESCEVRSDNDIKEAQRALEGEIEEKKSQINNYENNLIESEKKFLEQIMNNNIDDSTSDDTSDDVEERMNASQEKQKKSLIWYLAVLVICVIISCMIVVCYYVLVFEGRLKNGEEIMSIFELPYIGEISKKDLKTSVSELENEIESMCLESQERNIFVSVMTNIGNIEEYFSVVKEKLAQDHVDILFGGNITGDTDSMKKARCCKNILLILGERETTYSAIDSVLQRCNNWGINIIGVININDK